MNARNDMLERLRGRREGFTLPQPFYIDPAYFRLDMEMIWYRDWLFVGHDCELTPGSFMTVQIGDYSVILVRDLKGTIRAFHNTCRHRGSRICAAEKGAAVRLVCPYHQWSYDLDGRLLFARQVAEGFDKSAYGLKAVACESVAGYLFVCLAETPPDFVSVPQDDGALFRAASPWRSEGRARDHDCRARELEACLGEQSRVLPLPGEPSRALQDFP